MKPFFEARHLAYTYPGGSMAVRDISLSVAEASMTAVDRLGFHLRLKTGDRVHGCRVAFLREVGNKDEARAVLIEK